VLFSNIGDTYGRKKAIVLRVVLMWLSLMGIGCLPTYYDIGVLATVLLAVMRLLQGAVSRRRVCG
jgi:MFS family permease